MAEAEAHHGPSLIIAYSPCAMHGIANMGASASNAKLAVDSGEWVAEGRGAGDGVQLWQQKAGYGGRRRRRRVGRLWAVAAPPG